jgi:hypothetical protein
MSATGTASRSLGSRLPHGRARFFFRVAGVGMISRGWTK